ncbi:hypothetical protein GCM10009584_31170 [Ornithinimicrobium humiphilum]|uniref:hypothetical protein n=1 Tax=Ornithinimicrobium humiphilum TaxID=125288 RepID=UPI0014797997|nr:hypothetical protein [Ornithinimicrobium humiphilum]
MSSTVASPSAGRQAAALGHWREAYALYTGTDPGTLPPEDLETFAEAAWWSCRADEAIELRERAVAAYQEAADPASAARLAASLSWDHVGRGAFAVAQGWLARAERLLAAEPEGREHADLLPGGRRPAPGGGVDRRRQQVLRPARRERLPGGLPHPPGPGDAARRQPRGG